MSHIPANNNMDSREHPDTNDADTQGYGTYAFPNGQAAENPSRTAGNDTTQGHGLIYDHEFDPNCLDCQRRTFELLNLQSHAPSGIASSVYSNPGQQFAEYPTMTMGDDTVFQSLSDFEDVNFFNQPYLLQAQVDEQLHFQQQQQQQQQQQYHQQHQLDFSSVVPPSGFTDPFEPQQQQHHDEAIEPPRFHYDPPPVEFPDYSSFNFNTLPHRPAQQPIAGEPWMPAVDNTLFAPALPETIKNEIDEAAGIPIILTQPTDTMTMATLTQTQNPSMLEPVAAAATAGSLAPPSRHSHAPSRPPRRLLPAASLRRPVHRQPEVRARRSPVIQMSPQAAAERAAKDRFLVQSRREGVSYKDIKRLGNFKEAESTLRGRYRTLTKEKKDRQRDPKWNDLDDHLLKEAVRVLAHGQHPDRAKLSWMAVSVYIKEHGGYEFGYSTCHKRWMRFEAAGQLGDTGYDDSWEDEDEEDDHTDEGYGESQVDEHEQGHESNDQNEDDDEDEDENSEVAEE
ncbi:hypothetical protein M440DRAFT_355973 [Trichoderma longibrachiatum ATCC 18648]|uniref:Myb-like domain-containing protein n=1 Tax=Trichoderma longibrachiatum ATCC 18648 TaxID=983965 RepID=A0A2T4C260_TRILO|nr:hypothetical protein M440DRAFT_355973 [Trichoderma longibrachiatum ATCC 18648]